MSQIENLLDEKLPTPIHEIHAPEFQQKHVRLFLKRDDLIDPEISGNKWRKLKFNLDEAERQKFNTILTFGGAYSNHIAATAAACKLAGMHAIGVIRGEEINEHENHTLQQAAKNGMKLKFVSREDYRRKTESEFLEILENEFGNFFLIPEGGANIFGMNGCAEIMHEVEDDVDFICVACGTGTTMAGIVAATKHHQSVLGFPALKDAESIEKNIRKLLSQSQKDPFSNYRLITEYHFGGFAKHTHELLHFMHDFKNSQNIMLDFIYTAKMMYGIFQLARKNFFPPHSKILAIHTGGLQGNHGLKILREFS